MMDMSSYSFPDVDVRMKLKIKIVVCLRNLDLFYVLFLYFCCNNI